MTKLTTAILKQKIVDHLIAQNYIIQCDANDDPEDIQFFADLANPKEWKRIQKCRAGKFDEESEHPLTTLWGCEHIWFKGHDATEASFDETLAKPIFEEIKMPENWMRTFHFQEGDNCHMIIITNPTDTEIIAMLYHQD